MSNVNSLTALAPGFEDTVLDSQAVFRSILDAVSRPGMIVTIAPCPQTPAPLAPAAAATLLCLADMDTPIWLDPASANAAVREYLGFHCGTPLVEAPADAKFAVISDAADMPGLSAFNTGDELYPDHSATVLVTVAGFGNGARFELSGPGIEDRQVLAVDGLPDWFPAAWETNRKGYPTGIDILFCSDDAIVGLPRSTKLELLPCM